MPAALLLLMILLLQGNGQNQQQSCNAAPQNGATALLASLLANNLTQNSCGGSSQVPVQNIFNPTPAPSVPAPSVPAFIQDNGQSTLIEKLSQLSEGEMELLKKLNREQSL